MILLAALLASSIWIDQFDLRIGDANEWRRVSIDDVPQPDDSITLRADVDLTNLRRVPGHPVGIYFGAMASHELWWDGVKLGGGGVVARTKEGEVPGPIESHYQIPDALAQPGVHRLEIRASAFHRGFSPRHGYWTPFIADYDSILTARTRRAHLAMAGLSGIVLTAVFAFAMFWLTRRDRSFLLLGTLCLAAAALLIVESWRALFGYTYDWHIVRMWGVAGLSWLVGVQLVALLVTRFPHRHGRWLLAATAAAASIAPWFPRGWDSKAVLIFVICCTVAVAWAAFAALRRMHGSVLALLGTAAVEVALLLDPRAWVDNLVYYALNFLFLCLLCSHALEARREQQQTARLQLEILRRHLQPHFLMNTLTALSEWIEQEPKTAVRMIESLSDELRILGEMSTRTLVSADDELRLCRTHLANMSLRKDVAYALEVDGVDGARMVPPAIFHTLVENAITHGGAGVGPVVMRLSSRTEGGRTRYVFEAPAEWRTGNPACPDRQDCLSSTRTGAGTRYIEARLREAWGNAWSFSQGPAGSVWRAEIEVPA